MNLIYKTASIIATIIVGLNAMDDSDPRPGIPRISGRAVEWLHSSPGDLYARVILNETDEKAREGNKGKGQPIMLSEVNRIDKVDEGISPYVALLEEGSHIEFQLKGKGPCGFGFSIATGHGDIVTKLYRSDCEGTNNYLTVCARRYQAEPKTIMVDSFKTIGVTSPEEKVKYMFCDIKAWELESFTKDGIEYPRRVKRECAVVKADVKGGGLHQGQESESKFGSISNTKDGPSIGSLRLQFLIFADQKARDQFYKSYQDLTPDDF